MKPAREKLRRYSAVFRKRAWIIALVAVLAMGGVVYQLGLRAPQYRAEGNILVVPQVILPTPLEAGPATGHSAYRTTILNDVVQLLRSRTIAERVAARVEGVRPEELARRLAVKNIPGTDFLAISVVHEAPGQAALIANTLAQELVNFNAQINRAEATSARKFIEEQLGLVQDQLGAAEQALLDFRIRTGTAAVPEEVSRTAQRTFDVQSAYDGAVLDETTARARVAAIRSHLVAQNDGQLASISIATNPIVAQIRDHLTGLELELATLRQMYTDEHPKVQAMLGRIADDQQRLRTEASKVLNDTSLGTSPTRAQLVREMINGEVDAAAARARAEAIGPILNRLQVRLKSVPEDELTLARLQRDVRNAEQLSERLSALHAEALIRESQAGSSGRTAIVVVDPALVPARPVPSPLPIAAMLAGLLGSVLGAALALAVESVEARVRSAAQAGGVLGVPGLIPFPTMSARRSYRYLTSAPGVASLLVLPLLVMTLGVGASPHVGQAGAMTLHPDRFSQAMVQTLHVARDLCVAQVTAILAGLDHFSQAVMQTLHVPHVKTILGGLVRLTGHGS
jgi:uncharacterized protein involved in exopolysaccharide biosynthesis